MPTSLPQPQLFPVTGVTALWGALLNAQVSFSDDLESFLRGCSVGESQRCTVRFSEGCRQFPSCPHTLIVNRTFSCEDTYSLCQSLALSTFPSMAPFISEPCLWKESHPSWLLGPSSLLPPRSSCCLIRSWSLCHDL